MFKFQHPYFVSLGANRDNLFFRLQIFLIAIQFGSGMKMAKGQINVTSSANDHSIENRVSGSIELGSAILCDIVISVALVHFLRVGRSGIKRTEKMIDLLIIYAIGIGSLTVIISALNLATWLALPSKLIYVAFHIVLSKLYVNSLLISENKQLKILNSSSTP
ncbi:hypothetical protein ONZ45_g12994 [Pleurotus djamor]|nr:hypothetical protein ONZ45_g12994 [Pleurotus djamor]